MPCHDIYRRCAVQIYFVSLQFWLVSPYCRVSIASAWFLLWALMPYFQSLLLQCTVLRFTQSKLGPWVYLIFKINNLKKKHLHYDQKLPRSTMPLAFANKISAEMPEIFLSAKSDSCGINSNWLFYYISNIKSQVLILDSWFQKSIYYLI